MLRRSEASGVIRLTRQPGMGKKFDMPHAMRSRAGPTNYRSALVTNQTNAGESEAWTDLRQRLDRRRYARPGRHA